MQTDMLLEKATSFIHIRGEHSEDNNPNSGIDCLLNDLAHMPSRDDTHLILENSEALMW